MTLWRPDLARAKGPRYRAIAEALAADVRAGRLKPGTRLPTHRDLAETLRVTVGTVSRAYAEAERRGVVRGEVGRGTFVQAGGPGRPVFGLKTGDEPALVDFSLNFPVGEDGDEVVSRGLAALARDRGLGALLGYLHHAGTPRQRAAGASWIRRAGLPVDAAQVVVCNGAQHGLAIALSSLAAPGDVVLTESLTYPVFKTLAGLLHLKIQGLPIDGEGLRPEAFEAACKTGSVRLLYLIPTIQNPTASTLSEARRRTIAAIAEAHDVTILEDDIYGLLPTERPRPLAHHAPERTIYLTSLSKTVAPGLRIGYLAAPARLVDRMIPALGATAWSASPLMAQLAAMLIEDGSADAILDARRKEAVARQSLAKTILKAPGAAAHPQAFHLWLPLPEPWRGEDFADRARRRGVAVNPGEVFAAGASKSPAGVRICLGATRRRDQVEKGLWILRDILAGEDRRHQAIV